MHDHNLDDLIIDTVAPKNNKAKGFLTIVALFIVIIIVMIIFTRTFINPEKNTALILEDDLSTEIAPELKLQEITENDVKKPEAPKEVLPEPVEIPQNSTPTETTLPTHIEEKLNNETETEVSTEEVLPSSEVPKVEEPSVEVPQTQVAPVAIPDAEPQKVEPIKKPVKPVVQDAYYIQVGSYRQQPSASFTQRIKNNGFSYTLTKPNSKGIKKLLIGPYNSRAEVDKALKSVRDRILKQAFVVKK